MLTRVWAMDGDRPVTLTRMHAQLVTSTRAKLEALTTDDVGRSGDIAYEVGKVSLTIQPVGKEPTTSAAKYVVVWKRQPDGSWKLHRDIWNSLPAKQ